MDLRPTPEQEQVRAECRAWLREHLPWEYGTGLPPRFATLDEEVAFGREWQHQLAEARWVGVTWPADVGGRGAGPLVHYVVQEELARARAPELVGRIGINLVGPTLLAHGTDEQRARWLGPILRADILFCQLFSEPGCGQRPGLALDAGGRVTTAAGASRARRSGRRTPSSRTGASASPAPTPT